MTQTRKNICHHFSKRHTILETRGETEFHRVFDFISFTIFKSKVTPT